MEQQAQYLIKIFFLCSFISCVNNDVKEFKLQLVSNTDTSLHFNNGIVYYKNNLFSGTVYTLYNNSKDTAEIRNYLLGKEDGVWKNFYPNHSLKEIREFKNGKKVGKMKAYWDNKNVMIKCFFEDDEYDGLYKEWNRNGTVIRNMNYVKGHEEGSQQMFYDNGKVRSNYIIKEGKRFGLLGTKNCINVSDSIFKK